MLIQPDLTARPHTLSVEFESAASPEVLFRAWTEQFDKWFAAPGSVLMKPEVNAPFYFATHFGGSFHPHYGRFLSLEPLRLVELTWVTGAGGTEGAETVVTVKLSLLPHGTKIQLTHAGFRDEKTKLNHEVAWPLVLAQLEKAVADVA